MPLMLLMELTQKKPGRNKQHLTIRQNVYHTFLAARL